MARIRLRFSPESRAKIAPDAIKVPKAVGELAQKHKLHAIQTDLLNKELLDGASDLFEDGRRKSSKESDDNEPDKSELYE